jgi:hypothetical protein
MKIEAGKYYRTRDGQKVGPMNNTDNEGAKFYSIVTGLYFEDGTFGYGESIRCPRLDLIAEWTDEPAKPGPTFSSETIDQIAIDSLKWHFAQGFDNDLEKEAFRVVLKYYGASV